MHLNYYQPKSELKSQTNAQKYFSIQVMLLQKCKHIAYQEFTSKMSMSSTITQFKLYPKTTIQHNLYPKFKIHNTSQVI